MTVKRGCSLVLGGQLRAGTLAALVAFFTGTAQADSIKVDLGPSHTVTSQTFPSLFDDLDGTALGGQALSVDFGFLNDEFVRVFSVTSNAFQVLVKLQTNSVGFVGFLDGTGYLIDINGNPIPGYGITGSASGSDGWMAISLFPLLKDEDGTPNDDLPRPFDFYGVHYDLMFPNVNDDAIFVTKGEFWLSSADGGVFGIGPGIPDNIVPDSGATLLLLGTGLLLSICLRGVSPRNFRARLVRSSSCLLRPEHTRPDLTWAMLNIRRAMARRGPKWGHKADRAGTSTTSSDLPGEFLEPARSHERKAKM
jgi:hypothetical protein